MLANRGYAVLQVNYRGSTGIGKAFVNASEGQRSKAMHDDLIDGVDKISKPLLIAQGANDPRVVQAESDQIVQAMKAKNIPVTYVLFPDEGHGFARPENSTAFNAVAEGFLAQCLGGRAQPIGDDFAGSSIGVPEGATNVPGLADALESHRAEVRK